MIEDKENFSMTIDVEKEKDVILERGYIKDLMEEEESKLYNFQAVDAQDEFFGGEEYKKLLNECGLKAEDNISELAKNEDDNDNSKPIIDYKQLSLKMTDISDGRKLVYKRLIRKGEGPKVPEAALVIYHYKFCHEYSSDPFDSSGVKGRPDRQRVSVGQLLPGLDLAFQSMSKKERAIFVFDSSVMFGELGVPPRIPGNSDIYAEIEIVDFTEKNLIDDFFEKTTEERLNYSFEDLISLVSQCRDDANAAFRNQRYAIALNKYLRGIDILYAMPISDDDKEKLRSKQLAKFHLNMGLSNLKLNRGPAAIKCCNLVLAKDSKNIKALYRKAKGLMIIGDYEDAARCLKLANRYAPNDTDILAAMKENEDLSQQYLQTEKQLARLMIQSPAATDNAVSQNTNSVIPNMNCEIAKNFRSQLVEFIGMPDKKTLPKLRGISTEESEILKVLCKEFKLDFTDKDGITIKKR